MLRTRSGMAVHRKGDDVRWIVKAIRKNKVYGTLIDLDAGKDGTFVPFFGRQASTVSTIARIARRTGAAVLPLDNYRVKSRRKLRVRIREEVEVDCTDDAELDIINTTRRCNEALEVTIRQHPGQWLWTHRRWRSGDKKTLQEEQQQV